MNSTLLSGRRSRITCFDPAAVVSRNITPALAYTAVFWVDVRRATISPSPSSGVEAKWNESAVPQISEPAPLTVKTPLANVAVPARPVWPTSWLVQPRGRAAVTVTLSNVDTLRTDGL